MRYLSIILLAGVLLTSCKKSEDPPPTQTPDTPEENVFGIVTDLNGNALANAQIHLIYQVNTAPVSPLDETQLHNAILYTTQVLTTECGGNVPLADGVNIEIFWDADDDHDYSAGDRHPPVCPPPQDNCPFQTVNFDRFTMNGVEIGTGAGTFGTDPTFTSYGANLEPSRFYLVIRCTDGDTLWRSDMIDIPDGLTEYDLHFDCFECEGSPIGETTMGFAYPNPAVDEFHLPMTLRANENVTISTTSISTGGTTTLFQSALTSGDQNLTLDISNLPNGLYVYTMSAGTFTARDTLLKNAPLEDLPGEPALQTTDSDGSFAINVPFGQTLTLREASSNPLGESTPLDSVRVVAVLNGYQPSDTTISLIAAEQHELTLRLRPQ